VTAALASDCAFAADTAIPIHINQAQSLVFMLAGDRALQ
jgi:hypothetical protein